MSLKLEKEKYELYQSAIKDVKYHNNRDVYTKLDMHIHSNKSDGMFTIEQIIFMARKFNLERIFITDHNTCLPGYKTLNSLPIAIKGNLKVDIGCEIATRIEDPSTGKFIPIEILAYFADPEKIQNFLDKYNFSYNVSQEEQLKMLLKICDNIGLKHSEKIDLPKGCFATEILCKDLRQYRQNRSFFISAAPIVWDEPKLFYKKLVANPRTKFYIDTTIELPYYKDTISEIIKAGGIPIVSHPFLYIYNSEVKVKKLLDYIFSTTDAMGVEAIHSSHTNLQRKFLINYAKNNNLLFSGGTDFHCGPQTILGYGQKKRPVILNEDIIDWLR